MELMHGMSEYRTYSQSTSGSYDHMQQPTPQVMMQQPQYCIQQSHQQHPQQMQSQQESQEVELPNYTNLV